MATVKSKAKRKERKHVESGAAHIRSTFNNTIVTITDSKGGFYASKKKNTKRRYFKSKYFDY